jgi:acylphosphatase
MNEENNSKPQEEKFVDQRATIIVKGNVQKVGYRDFVYRVAEFLEIKGVIENLTDGNARIVAEGKRKNLEEFIDRIKSFSSPIEGINEVIIEFEETKNEFEHFNIEHRDIASEISENLLPILLSVEKVSDRFEILIPILSEMNKKIEGIESILTIKETKKKRSQSYAESKIGRVLIFGPGQWSEGYSYRENVRKIIEEHFETIFPEDFDNINELMDWYKEHGINLTENKVKLSNRSSATKELILADYCSCVYIILMSPGAISEFSEFYTDRIAYKIRVFIPMEYYKSDSYISSGPLKVFGDKYNQVYAFEDESELLKLVREKADSDFEHEYLIKRKTTLFSFAI